MKIKAIVLFIGLGLLLLNACQRGQTGQQEEALPAIENVPAELTSMEGITTYWECPMKCAGKKFVSAGNCPECGMPLAEVHISPTQEATVDTPVTTVPPGQ
jgi:hypothetical protein